MPFEFATATRIIFGDRAINNLGKIAGEAGKKALLVTSAGQPDPSIIVNLLRESNLDYQMYEIQGEPEINSVVQGVEMARKYGCDLVIGYGGGSPLDTGKAIAAMLTNPGELLDYLEVIGKGQVINNSAAPFIAIPTTSGTGSEVTRNAVLLSPENKIKVSLRSLMLLPKVALVDPQLTYSVPPDITASTGMDALAQVLEPYVSIRANSMVDMFCVEGMKKAARSLEMAYRDAKNATARSDMSWVSLLGGLSLANAGLGAVHGFAAAIGGLFDVPHGVICACLLPGVVRVNIQALRARSDSELMLSRYEDIGKILTGNQNAGCDDGIDWLERICKKLQIPRLSKYGITSQYLQTIISKAKNASSMKANPIVLTDEELLFILQEAL